MRIVEVNRQYVVRDDSATHLHTSQGAGRKSKADGNRARGWWCNKNGGFLL